MPAIAPASAGLEVWNGEKAAGPGREVLVSGPVPPDPLKVKVERVPKGEGEASLVLTADAAESATSLDVMALTAGTLVNGSAWIRISRGDGDLRFPAIDVVSPGGLPVRVMVRNPEGGSSQSFTVSEFLYPTPFLRDRGLRERGGLRANGVSVLISGVPMVRFSGGELRKSFFNSQLVADAQDLVLGRPGVGGRIDLDLSMARVYVDSAHLTFRGQGVVEGWSPVPALCDVHGSMTTVAAGIQIPIVTLGDEAWSLGLSAGLGASFVRLNWDADQPFVYHEDRSDFFGLDARLPVTFTLPISDHVAVSAAVEAVHQWGQLSTTGIRASAGIEFSF